MTAGILLASLAAASPVPQGVYRVVLFTGVPSAATPGAQILVSAPAQGAFLGHEDEIATWTGGTWIFEAAAEGDLAYDQSRDDLYLFEGSAALAEALWPGSGWRRVAPRQPRVEHLAIDTQLSAATLWHGDHYAVDASGQNIEIELPFPDVIEGRSVTITKIAGYGTVTVTVSDGGTINGSPSRLLASVFDSLTLTAAAKPTPGSWIVTSGTRMGIFADGFGSGNVSAW